MCEREREERERERERKRKRHRKREMIELRKQEIKYETKTAKWCWLSQVATLICIPGVWRQRTVCCSGMLLTHLLECNHFRESGPISSHVTLSEGAA